jgi:hypothetical protein
MQRSNDRLLMRSSNDSGTMRPYRFGGQPEDVISRNGPPIRPLTADNGLLLEPNGASSHPTVVLSQAEHFKEG